jgi:hypothetical protein
VKLSAPKPEANILFSALLAIGEQAVYSKKIGLKLLKVVAWFAASTSVIADGAESGGDVITLRTRPSRLETNELPDEQVTMSNSFLLLL